MSNKNIGLKCIELLKVCLDVPDNIFLVLSNSYVILEINDAAEKFFECKKNDIHNKSIIDLFKKKIINPFFDIKLLLNNPKDTTVISKSDKNTDIIWNIIPPKHTVNASKFDQSL